MDERKRPRKRKPKNNNKNKSRKFLIALFFVIIIACVAWGLAMVYHQYDKSRNVQLQTQIDAVQNGQSNEFKQISPDVPLYVLIVGVDDNYPSQTNFVGLAAINKDKKHIDFIMLPDNTKIEGRKEKGTQMLSDIYTEGGVKLTRAVVEDIFHIPIPFYAIFTKDSFKNMIDTNGGFSMYVEKNMYHEDASGTTDIDILQGYQKIDSDIAFGYMRYIDSDGYISRAQRQERFIKLFYSSLVNRFGIVNAYHAHRFWGEVDSNISSWDMTKLAFAFRNVPVTDIKFYILPGEMSHNKKDNYWTFDPIGVQKIIGSTNNAIASSDSTQSSQPKKQ